MSARIAGLTLIVAVALSARVGAQDASFARRGDTALGIERLLGVTWTHARTSNGGSSESENVVSITRVTSPVSALLSTYSYPRLGLDYFFADAVSVGIAAGYAQTTGSKSSSSSSSSDLASFHSLLLAPRFGYAHALDPLLALWPRIGATYAHVWRSGLGGSATLDQLALTLEVILLIKPFSHVCLSVGPALDLGLAGSSSNGFRSNDTTTTEIGLQTALLVDF